MPKLLTSEKITEQMETLGECLCKDGFYTALHYKQKAEQFEAAYLKQRGIITSESEHAGDCNFYQGSKWGQSGCNCWKAKTLAIMPETILTAPEQSEGGA